MTRGVWFSRLAVALATIIWIVAWGRLGAVGLTQPSRWQDSTITSANGQPVAAQRTFDCRLNTFQRGNLIYRTCNRDGLGAYVVAFDADRRTVVTSWDLTAAFLPPSWFTAVASGPDGTLAVVGEESGAVALLHPDGTVEGLPALPTDEIFYGFGWQGGKLSVATARFDAGGSAPPVVSTYTPGAGWAVTATLPTPACGDGLTCTPLVATATADGWATYYARAPRQPTDPAKVAAGILLVSPAGTTQVTQTVTLTVESRAYRLEDGQVRWSSRFADRTAGNILNYGGFTSLQQGTDGKFTVLPTPPDDLFRQGGSIAVKPGISALTQNYELAADRLIWQPNYNPGGFAGSTERALLLADRWLVLRDDTNGIYLQERPRDPTASYPDNTFTARGPRILGQQADLLGTSDISAPLLPAAGGGYWFLGRANTVMQIGPDLRRLDDRNPVARLGLLFSDFGTLTDKFHREAIWPKRAALAWILFAWPLLTVGVLLRKRLAPDDAASRAARLRPAALLYLTLALLSAYWFWTATAFF